MVSAKLWWFLAIYLIAYIKLSISQRRDLLLATLLNTAHIEGSDVTLAIEADDRYTILEGIWMECITRICRRIGRPGRIYYDTNSTRGSRYHLSTDHYSLTILTIRGALLEDGGTYKFEDQLNIGSYNVEIIMLESQPVCERNTTNRDLALEGDIIVMSCQVRYQGRWAPRMVWQEGGANMTDVINDTVVGARNIPGLAKYSVAIAARREINGTVFRMVTFFPATGMNSTANRYEFHANNAPNYTYTFDFQPLQVMYTEESAVQYTEQSEQSVEIQGKHSDSAITAASLVPTLLLVLCSAALGYLLWKYRRLRQDKCIQATVVSTNAETIPNENITSLDEEADSAQLPYEPLRLDPVGASTGATGGSAQESVFYENMGQTQEEEEEVMAIYEIATPPPRHGSK